MYEIPGRETETPCKSQQELCRKTDRTEIPRIRTVREREPKRNPRTRQIPETIQGETETNNEEKPKRNTGSDTVPNQTQRARVAGILQNSGHAMGDIKHNKMAKAPHTDVPLASMETT
ncbi:hypothetical protein SDC9_139828 [bioreactor metagenome]|uniref:Uncharacterized protein n=1 Tax=bioreactor metagenome TaxID=1076179 RepID=A0A645DVR6_9ZZZZ